MKNRNLFDVINQRLDFCLLNIKLTLCCIYILAEEGTVLWGYGTLRTSNYIYVYFVIWKKWLDNLKRCNICVQIIKI